MRTKGMNEHETKSYEPAPGSVRGNPARLDCNTRVRARGNGLTSRLEDESWQRRRLNRRN